MKVEYNRQGAARKELVQAISAITGEKAKYLFLPTKAYRIGSILVGKTGTVECEDDALFQKVVKELEVKGFKPEVETAVQEESPVEPAAPEETPELEPTQEKAEPEAVMEPEVVQENADTEPIPETPETEATCEPAGDPEPEKVDNLTISLPDDFTKYDYEKLQNLVASKAGLLKKALETDDLTITRNEGKLNFPWFHEADSAKVLAYSKLVMALCQFAKKAKRITAKEHEVPNEKYAFRCFLLRLGFIGQEYKECRKILLENLRGSTAYRDEVKSNEISQ